MAYLAVVVDKEIKVFPFVGAFRQLSVLRASKRRIARSHVYLAFGKPSDDCLCWQTVEEARRREFLGTAYGA